MDSSVSTSSGSTTACLVRSTTARGSIFSNLFDHTQSAQRIRKSVSAKPRSGTHLQHSRRILSPGPRLSEQSSAFSIGYAEFSNNWENAQCEQLQQIATRFSPSPSNRSMTSLQSQSGQERSREAHRPRRRAPVDNHNVCPATISESVRVQAQLANGSTQSPAC